MSQLYRVQLEQPAQAANHKQQDLLEQKAQPIETDGADSLLNVIEQAGYQAEFGCRQGFCGACRMTLLQGEVAYESAPLAFVRENEILPCCCRAQSDLTLSKAN